jgi:hypothetical protein
MIRGVFITAAVLSPFFFPFPATLVLAACASVFFPPIALAVGLLTDLLYYTPTASMVPVATLAGLLISIMVVFVRRFLKARIIGG